MKSSAERAEPVSGNTVPTPEPGEVGAAGGMDLRPVLARVRVDNGEAHASHEDGPALAPSRRRHWSWHDLECLAVEWPQRLEVTPVESGYEGSSQAFGQYRH